MPTLNWIGKEKVINHHQDVPYKILEPQYGFADGEQQSEPNDSGNKIIHGDNLEALKSLLPEYEGKVKCIYIDPPYNTGNESWVYNDNVNHPKIKKWLGEVVGKDGEDLTRHDKWLCMMYPRLKLLNKLLAKDGALVISIGYHEVSNLVLACNEIFGNRQIITVTVQTSGGKPSGGFNFQQEYLIFIVPNDFTPNPLLFSGGKTRSPYEGLTLATFDKTQRPNQTYPIYVNKKDGSLFGIGKSLQERIKSGFYNGNLEDFQFNYEEAPQGTVAIWPITSKGKECVWRLIPSRLVSDWNKGYIKISPNKTINGLNEYSIQYLPSGVITKIESGVLEITGSEAGVPTLVFGDNKTVGGQIPTIWIEKSFYSVNGTTLLSDVFNKKAFSYPKPLELITEVLRSVSSQNDIILDSFAGSGTTAHAALNLNKEDGGNRKYILIEMEDYANTVTAERIKRVIKGYDNSESSKSGLKTEGTGGSFNYYQLGEPLFLENDVLNEAVGIENILKYIWYSETRTPYVPLNSPSSYGLEENYRIGSKDQTDYYFYYTKDAVTTVDYDFMAKIKHKSSQYIIYADNCLLDAAFMLKHHIIFKKIPRDITRF